MTFDPWDVVVVPFPFTDRQAAKKRPALVLNRTAFHGSGHSILTMITSQTDTPWPGDTALKDLPSAGLPKACWVRLKLFTIDNRLILKRIGSLSEDDRQRIQHALRQHLTV